MIYPIALFAIIAIVLSSAVLSAVYLYLVWSDSQKRMEAAREDVRREVEL